MSSEQQQPVTPPSLTGPTPPSVDAGNPFTTLPSGWTTAADPKDGRLFYWHAATKRSSWTHPNAAFDHGMNANNADAATTTTSTNSPLPPQSNNNNASVFDYFAAPTTSSSYSRNHKSRSQPPPPPPMSNGAGAAPGNENPWMASRRPDNHQCGAIAALILCFPLGIFALYHSIRVDQCWKSGQYSDAFIHARQSPQFSSWGIMIGIVFWVCWFFFRRGRGEWEWPDWNFGD